MEPITTITQEPIRLNKYLVAVGVCSRREADRLITQNEVIVDGQLAKLGQKVSGHETIVVAGKTIEKKVSPPVYLVYHKPVGIICTSDVNANDNIIEAVNYPERVFYIGRLDVASSGLILLTSDGDVVNKILRAKGKHEKEYIVTINRSITPGFLQAMRTGIMVLGRKTLPAKVSQLDDRTFNITIVEGRNRQIRRMCEALGVNVRSLQRVRIMHIKLGDLPIGSWRHLTPNEKNTLML